MNWIKHKIKNIIIIVLCLGLVVAWIALKKPSSEKNQPSVQESKIPDVFWEGGPRTLLIQAMSTTEGVMNVTLRGPKPNVQPEEERQEISSEKMPIGQKIWTIHFPADTKSGTLQLDSKNPGMGDNINWTITLDGKVIQQDQVASDKPADPNWSMSLKFELGDFLATKNETPMDEPAAVAPAQTPSSDPAPSSADVPATTN